MKGRVQVGSVAHDAKDKGSWSMLMRLEMRLRREGKEVGGLRRREKKAKKEGRRERGERARCRLVELRG